jgi:hypothetical protein
VRQFNEHAVIYLDSKPSNLCKMGPTDMHSMVKEHLRIASWYSPRIEELYGKHLNSSIENLETQVWLWNQIETHINTTAYRAVFFLLAEKAGYKIVQTVKEKEEQEDFERTKEDVPEYDSITKLEGEELHRLQQTEAEGRTEKQRIEDSLWMQENKWRIMRHRMHVFLPNLGEHASEAWKLYAKGQLATPIAILSREAKDVKAHRERLAKVDTFTELKDVEKLYIIYTELKKTIKDDLGIDLQSEDIIPEEKAFAIQTKLRELKQEASFSGVRSRASKESGVAFLSAYLKATVARKITKIWSHSKSVGYKITSILPFNLEVALQRPKEQSLLKARVVKATAKTSKPTKVVVKSEAGPSSSVEIKPKIFPMIATNKQSWEDWKRRLAQSE